MILSLVYHNIYIYIYIFIHIYIYIYIIYIYIYIYLCKSLSNICKEFQCTIQHGSVRVLRALLARTAPGGSEGGTAEEPGPWGQ